MRGEGGGRQWGQWGTKDERKGAQRREKKREEEKEKTRTTHSTACLLLNDATSICMSFDDVGEIMLVLLV